MDTGLHLVKPAAEYAEEIRAYRQEFMDTGGEFHGDCALQHFDDPLSWLSYNRALENHEIAASSWTAYDQYLCVRADDERVVGMINFRRTDDAALGEYAGEIGFSVRPSERRKGYAKAMLKECLSKCAARGIESAVLTCNRANQASRRTILACGGAFERNAHGDEGMERYLLKTTLTTGT